MARVRYHILLYFFIPGILSSTLSLAFAFFTFSVSLPTEDGPLSCTKLSRWQMVNNSAIAFIVVLGQKVVLFTALSNLSDEIGLGGCLWPFVLIFAQPM